MSWRMRVSYTILPVYLGQKISCSRGSASSLERIPGKRWTWIRIGKIAVRQIRASHWSPESSFIWTQSWECIFTLSAAGASQVAQRERICLQCKRHGLDPWVGKIPWRRKWQPTPLFLPGKSHGQRSLEGYSPRGRKRVRDDLATKQ